MNTPKNTIYDARKLSNLLRKAKLNVITRANRSSHGVMIEKEDYAEVPRFVLKMSTYRPTVSYIVVRRKLAVDTVIALSEAKINCYMMSRSDRELNTDELFNVYVGFNGEDLRDSYSMLKVNATMIDDFMVQRTRKAEALEAKSQREEEERKAKQHAEREAELERRGKLVDKANPTFTPLSVLFHTVGERGALELVEGDRWIGTYEVRGAHETIFLMVNAYLSKNFWSKDEGLLWNVEIHHVNVNDDPNRRYGSYNSGGTSGNGKTIESVIREYLISFGGF